MWIGHLLTWLLSADAGTESRTPGPCSVLWQSDVMGVAQVASAVAVFHPQFFHMHFERHAWLLGKVGVKLGVRGSD